MKDLKEVWKKRYGNKDPWGNDWVLSEEDKVLYDKQEEHRQQVKYSLEQDLKRFGIQLIAVLLIFLLFSVTFSIVPFEFFVKWALFLIVYKMYKDFKLRDLFK